LSKSDNVWGMPEMSLQLKLAATLVLVFALAAIVTLGISGALAHEPHYSATSPTPTTSP
jgi:hypothetical protein